MRLDGVRQVMMGVVLAVGLATGAQAETVLLTCPVGTSVAKFTPGVTLTPRQTVSEGKALFGPCVGLPADLVYASFEYQGTGLVSCLTNGSVGRFTVTWSDGSTSTVDHATIVTARPGVVVSSVSGTVTSGTRFVGAFMEHTVALAQLDLTKCLSPGGFTAAAGPGTLTVLGL